MKIAICSTYLHGGGGIAANRLKQALTAAGHEVSMIVSTQKGIFNIPFVAERLSFLPYEKDKSVRFLFSLANFGLPLHKHPDVLAADIIHLHWINQGLLSLNGIKKLKELGKPIIWTLHDMWVFTGGCHYNRGCDGYLASCGNCPYLKNPEKHDMSNRLWKKKEKLFRSGIEYVTCSNWLAERARGSSILSSITINSIPNPINIDKISFQQILVLVL